MIRRYYEMDDLFIRKSTSHICRKAGLIVKWLQESSKEDWLCK